jgi:predicted HicB family RNase H-like nuclease
VKPEQTRSIRVSEHAHRKLKLMAAKSGEHVYQIIDRLLKPASKGKK